MGVPGNANTLLLKSAAAGGAYEISRSLRFNPSDTPYLQKVFSGNGSNPKIRTFSCWVKRSGLGSNKEIFSSSNTRLSFDSDTLYAEAAGAALQTTQVFRDVSAWYHILFAWDTTQATSSNRSKLYVNGAQVTNFSSANYTTQNADSHFATKTGNSIIGQYQNIAGYVLDGYLADIHFIDGQQLDPSSFAETDATTGQWVPKAFTGSYGTNGFKLNFSDNSTTAALGTDTSGNGNTWTVNNFSLGFVDQTPSGLSYRDSSSSNQTWDQSSSSSTTSSAIGPDRIYWVDLGSSKSFNKITLSVVASGQSSDTSTNFIAYFSTSSSSTGSSICGGGCTVSKASASSGTTPGTITVTFAGFASQSGRYIGITNGSGGQGGTYTYSNFKVLDDQSKDNDSLVDTPTSYGTDTGAGGEVRGNYCTLNPLDGTVTGVGTLSNGNLDFVQSSSGARTGRGTLGVSSGKWYWEYTQLGGNSSPGIANASANTSTYVGGDANGWSYFVDGSKYTNNTGTSYGASYTTSDVIGIALNLDAGTLTFYKNGTSQGTAFSSLTGTMFPAISTSSVANVSFVLNFGQRAFAYTAPSGFKALCDTNLPTPVVAKPNTAMDVKLYTGNGSTQTISGLNFSPDLVWLKNRSSSGYGHRLVDTVRGNTQFLMSHNAEAEAADVNGITAFNSDGFSVGNGGDFNVSSNAFVSWNWDAGTSTVTNTAGSITASLRANTSSGFSVVSFTGTGANATIGHGGLVNLANGMIIVKNRSSATNWRVYHSALGNTKVIFLSTTGTPDTSSVYWNNTSPTSTVFSAGSDDGINGNGNAMVAYCFAPVSGYSSFGSYTGNGSSDGPFVYTGHKPRWLMIKCSSIGDAYQHWHIFDTARSGYNVTSAVLQANTSTGEGSFAVIDLLSNGFKIKYTDSFFNQSGSTWIFASFAENPFQYARAR